MRHWLVTRSEDGDRCFVITPDLQTPADAGYDPDAFSWRRLTGEPGHYDIVDQAGAIAESAELRAAAERRLPRTVEELEQLIADRVAAATSQASEGGGDG